MQGVGTFIAPLLASRVFFANAVDTNAGLKNVQWTYLGVACFVALLIILFWLAPFPEITDADQEALEGQIQDVDHDVGSFWSQTNLFLGVSSQFCYVGAQAAVAGYFINFCQEAGRSSAASCKLLFPGDERICHTNNFFCSGFVVGRTGSLRLYAFCRQWSHDAQAVQASLDAYDLLNPLHRIFYCFNCYYWNSLRCYDHSCSVL